MGIYLLELSLLEKKYKLKEQMIFLEGWLMAPKDVRSLSQ